MLLILQQLENIQTNPLSEFENTSCFNTALQNIINFCPNYEPHSETHQILALQLTNCYRESAGIYTLNCVDSLNLNKINSQKLKSCLHYLGNDEIGTLLALYAQQVDKITDSCYYLTMNNFNQKAAKLSQQLLQASEETVSRIQNFTFQLTENIEKSDQFKSQIQQIYEVIQMQEYEQISAFKEISKLVSSINAVSNSSFVTLKTFLSQFEEQNKRTVVVQNNMFQSLKQIGVSVQNVDFNVGGIEKSSRQIAKNVDVTNQKLTLQNGLIDNIDSQVLSILEMSGKSLEKMKETMNLLSQNSDKLENNIKQINNDIDESMKKLQSFKSNSGSIYSQILNLNQGFFSFYVGVFCILYISDLVFHVDMAPLRQISIIFIVVEITLTNILQSLQTYLFCDIYVPLYVKMNKSKLFMTGRSDLLRENSILVYRFLKQGKIDSLACNKTIDTIILSYIIRALDLMLILKVRVVDGRKGDKIDKEVTTQSKISNKKQMNLTPKASQRVSH